MNELTAAREGYLDALAIKAGIRNLSSLGVHPDATGIIEREEKILKQLALGFAIPHQRGKQGMSTAGAMLALGLGTSDFQAALSSTMKQVTVRSLSAQADHRTLCKTFELPNFKPQEFPNVDLDVTLIENPQHAELTHDVGLVTSAGVSANVRSFGRNIVVSRKVIINDDIGLMAGIFANAGAAAARHEAGMVYALIESNPTMGDGQVMFHTDHGNIEATALDETNLASAMARLRTMTTPAGAQANLAAVILAVSPSLELAAKKLVHECNLNISVVASAWLPAGRWYLSADPELSPVVGLLHLRGSNGGVIVGPVDVGMNDSNGIGVRFDVGVAPVGRVGMVRGGAV